MARPSSIDDEELIVRLAGVFRDVGYEGASLAMLSQATGLQRASLYHRFPGGKQQMAEEVLRTTIGWASENVIGPLTRQGDVRMRWGEARDNLEALYDDGRKSCLLNMLMSPRNAGGPFTAEIKAALEALVDAFAHLARDAGASKAEAERAGQMAVTLVQGSLILSRGLGQSKPFDDALGAAGEALLSDPRGAR